MPSRAVTAVATAVAEVVAAALLGTLAACSSTDVLGEDLASLSTLPPSDVLRVQVVDHGLWGDTAFELEFRRDAQPDVSGIRLTGRWSDSARKFEVSRRSVRRRGPVTPAVLHDLDALLAYYRSDPDESCDDTRIVTVTQLRKGKTVATQQLVDKSCGEGAPGRTTFSDVFAGLTPDADSGRRTADG